MRYALGMPKTVREALKASEEAFLEAHPAPVARSLSYGLLAWLLDVSGARLAVSKDNPFPPAKRRRLSALLRRAAKGEPLAYLTGVASFSRVAFAVTRATLIPRPETEELVETVSKKLHFEKKTPLIVDIGTGSGCVAITLALNHPMCRVIATDISLRALRIAKTNAKTHLPEKKQTVTFLHANLFEKSLQTLVEKASESQILFVANLPYVPATEKHELDKSVVHFEPHRAVFGGRVGDELIKRFLQQVAIFQKTSTKIMDVFLEIDPSYAISLAKWSASLFPHHAIHLKKDGFDRTRFLLITAL